MPTRKIADIAPGPSQCRDREHDPPGHRVFSPGLYEHECPSCHHKQQFLVVVGGTLGA